MAEKRRAAFLSSLPHHPGNDTALFAETEGSIPGQPVPGLSERRDSFVTPEECKRREEISAQLWKEADEDKEKLFEIMREVQGKLQGRSKVEGRANAGLDLRYCKWDQVMQAFQSTANQWKTNPRRQTKTLSFIHKIGQNSATLESWLQLLPMGDYGSSICGVFQLAIGAVGQHAIVEETIFEALSEIPMILDGVRRYVEIYREMPDQHLEVRTFELFRAILRALYEVMRYFADSRSRKLFESIVKQATYKKDLLDCIEEVRKCAGRVKEEVFQCLARQVHDQRALLARVYQKSEQFEHHMQEQKRCFESMYMSLLDDTLLPLRESDQGHSTTPTRMISHGSLPADSTKKPPGKQEPPGSMLTAMSQVTSGPPTDDAKRMAKEAAEAGDRLLNVIGYDLEMPVKDTLACVLVGKRLDGEALSRVAAVVRHGKFRSFVEEHQSSTSLLVNARMAEESSENSSPLSFLVANLSQLSESLTATAPVFVVKHFCGRHRTSPIVDPSARVTCSAVGMMRSLVGQLLSQMRDKGCLGDLSLTGTPWQKIERGKPRALCAVFRDLIMQLPAGCVVLCAIDEVCAYETSMLRTETDVVIRRLGRLVAETQSTKRPVFKLLLTCRNRALGVSQYFSDRVLNLREDIEVDDAAAWAVSNPMHY